MTPRPTFSRWSRPLVIATLALGAPFAHAGDDAKDAAKAAAKDKVKEDAKGNVDAAKDRAKEHAAEAHDHMDEAEHNARQALGATLEGENQKHQARLDKLAQLDETANKAQRKDLTDKVATLREKENRRHEKAVARLGRAQGRLEDRHDRRDEREDARGERREEREDNVKALKDKVKDKAKERSEHRGKRQG